MNQDDFKALDASLVDTDCRLSVEYDHVEQEFSDASKVLVLYSKVRYSTDMFNWEAVLPTVRIPYRDPAMGFLLNGVIFSSVGIYQRAPGIVISKDNNESATGAECIDIVTSRNTTFKIAYRRNGISIIFRKNGKERSVPMGVFLKAISGLPYGVILKRFAFKPPALRYSFPCEVAQRSVDLAKVATFGIDGSAEPSIDECITATYKAISQYDASDSYSSHWKLGRIRAFFNNLHFKSEQNYESVLSVHSRAIGTYLDQELCLPIFVQNEYSGQLELSTFELKRGTFINEEIAAQLRWYNIPQLRVRYERSFILQEDTPFLFRAKGYTLADDIPELGLYSETLLGETELKKLNQSTLKMIEVNTPDGKKVISRSGQETDTGDFITLLNTLFTCAYRQLSDSSQYELANRVVIDYDRQVALEIEQVYQEIIDSLGGCNQLSNILQSLPTLPSNRLAEHLRDPSSKELAQAEITNVLTRAIAEDRTSALMRETPAAMTGIQLGQYGRIDSLHSPESDKIGSVQELTMMAKVNPSSGEIEVPYERVVHGVPTGRVEYVSAAKEKGKYIAGWDEKFETEYVQARYNGDVTTVEREHVHYRDVSPFCDMSVSRATVPFPEFSQPRRSLMASKMAGQAVPLLFPERPLVSTGADMEIPCLYYTAEQVVRTSIGDAYADRGRGSKLELVNVKWTKSLAIYTCVFLDRSFTFSVPFTATDKETLYSYNLNYKEGNLYDLDDIVFYNQSCDIGEHDLVEFMEQGTVPLIQGAGRPSLALGVNLRVMFKTCGSSTVDDGVVISSRIVRNRKLSSIQIFKYDYELRADEHFSTYNGAARLHSHVYEGMPVIVVQRRTATGLKEKFIRSDVDGDVIISEINESNKTAEVWVACLHDPELGDKVAGRHGNKSVIAKIIPEHDMPYDPATGETADIVLNPLSIPSRMNNGQLLESTAGYALGITGKHAVITPFYPGIKGKVEDMYKQAGGQLRRLYNPVYGKFTERPVFIGTMYFLKLEQMSNLKWSAVGAPRSVDPVFGQPIDSATEFKGQAISEWETWVFAATGSKKILNTLFTLYSSDALSRNSYFEVLARNDDKAAGHGAPWDETIGDVIQTKVDNKDALATQTVMRMMGQELQPISKSRFGFLPLNLDDITVQITPLDLKNHSEPVGDNEWCKVKLQEPVVNPFWIRNFPLNVVLGVKSVKTLVDEKHYLNVFTRGTFPASELAGRSKVQCITGIKAVIALLQNTTIEDAIARLTDRAVTNNLVQQGETVDAMESNSDEDASNEESAQSFTGVVMQENDGDNAVSHVPVDSAEIIQFLQRMQDAGMELRDLIWDYMPIMPKVFRQTTVIRGEEREHSFQKQIQHICDCASSGDIYRSLEELIGYGTAKKDDLMSLRGYFFGKGSSSGNHGKIRNAVLSKRVGFSGRTVIIPASEVEMSPYFVGVPWRIAMIELAEVLAIRMKKRAPEISNYLCQELDSHAVQLTDLTTRQWETILRSLGEFNPYVFNQFFPALDNSDQRFIYNHFRAIVRDICEGNVSKDGRVKVNGVWMDPECVDDVSTIDAMVVLVGRQPTLHKHSIRAFFGHLVDGYCKQMHPVVCSGFNADFDGDTMWDCQMLGEMKNESWRTLSVLQDLISEKDGSYSLTITQDTALGLYCATIFKDNAKQFTGDKLDYHFYDDRDELRRDLEYGTLHYYDVVVYRNNDKYYISTAGRVLVNSTVPGAFTALPFKDSWGICKATFGEDAISSFCEMQYDCVWVTTGIVADGYAKGVKVGNVLLDVCKNYGPRPSVDTTQRLYEIGIAASDLYGVTASMDDLTVDADITPLMEQPKEYVNKLSTLRQLGLISEDERRTATIRAWERMRKQASKAIISALPENSSLHYLMYSGARGKPDQIMQSVGFIGTISKTVTEDIEYPILHGFGSGLSSLELFQACYPTRIGVVSTQTGTKDTGYSTRQTVYMSSGMAVVDDDCGITNWTSDVPYDDDRVSVVWPDGRVTEADALLGQFVDPKQEQYAYLSKQLSRSGWMINEEILDWFLHNGYDELVLLDTTVKLRYVIKDSWKQQALEEGYSYALPYTVGRKVTQLTIDWIERHGLREVIMFSAEENESGQCFDKEAYLPVDYDASNYSLTLNGQTVDEEALYGRVVDETSEGYHYYQRLLDEGGTLTVRAMQYLTEKLLREVKFKDTSVLKITYEITSLFRELVTGHVAVGLLGLDTDGTVSDETLDYVTKYQFEALPVRTELTCLSSTGVCACCHGKTITTGQFSKLGENLGISAAQTQCEPLSQSTLNVTHSGGKRSAGIGLVSGLGYYMRMLQGRLVSKKTQDELEDFTRVSGYVQKNLHDERFFQIVSEDGKILESWTLNDAVRCCVADGAYVDKGTRVKSGWPRLDRYSSRDIFDSALKTRYLLLQEYRKIFENLNVSPKAYVLLAREQASICYLDEEVNMPTTKDCSDEIKKPTGNYVLRVSPQALVVNKYSGVAGFAFENVAAMIMHGLLDSNGLAMNSVLGNLVTGTTVGKQEAIFIPSRFGAHSHGYVKSEVRKYEDAIQNKAVGEYTWQLALDTSVKPETSVAASRTLTDKLIDDLLKIGSGDSGETVLLGADNAEVEDVIPVVNTPQDVDTIEEPELVMPEMAKDDNDSGSVDGGPQVGRLKLD